MELCNLPVFQRWLETPDSRSKASTYFYQLNKRDSVKAGALMQAFATTINSLNGKLGALDSTSATFVEDTAKLTTLRDQVASLARFCFELTHRSENRLPRVVYHVKIERALGINRHISKLRQVTGTFSSALDHAQCVEWLKSQIDIEICSSCGNWEYVGKFKDAYGDDFDETKVCRVCADNHYAFSDYYSRYVHQEDYRSARNYNGDIVICHEDDEDFTYDEDRDMWHHVDWVPPPPPIIGNYHSSKAYQRAITDEWSRLRHRWFGVELEVEIKDHAVDKHDKARMLHDLINDGERGKRVFFENDGSLSNGFEIITQPMSLPMHSDVWQWLRNRDATRHLLSHNTRTCGLHVHVNKDNLTQIQIAKVVTFVNDPRNESMIRAIARRYAEGYCKIKEKKIESAHQSSDRYEAINLTGRHTIEFRIFKGSLKYESVIAAIEFCNALCEFAALPSTNDVQSLTGDNFIDFINDAGAAETQVLRPYMNAVLQTA